MYMRMYLHMCLEFAELSIADPENIDYLYFTAIGRYKLKEYVEVNDSI